MLPCDAGTRDFNDSGSPATADGDSPVRAKRFATAPRPSGEPEVIAACDVVAASAGQALVSAGGCVALWSLAWEAVLTVDGRDPALAAINVWVAGLALVLGIAFWAQRNRIEHPSVAEPVG